MHVAAGRLAHAVDGVGDGEHVVRERPLESALLSLRRAEVDHPRVGSPVPEDRDRARVRRDVVHVRGEHHRRHEQYGRSGRPSVAAWEVVAELVHAMLGRHLVRRGLLVGLQATEAGDL